MKEKNIIILVFFLLFILIISVYVNKTYEGNTTTPGATMTGTTKPPGTTFQTGTKRPSTTKIPVIVDESLYNRSVIKAKTYLNSLLSGYFPTEVSTGGEDTLAETTYEQNYQHCAQYNNRIPSITGINTDGSYIYGNCTNYCPMNGAPTATLYNSATNVCS